MVVHKLRLLDKVGRWSKNVHFLSTFITTVGGQKTQNLVNVVCERHLIDLSTGESQSDKAAHIVLSKIIKAFKTMIFV